MEDILGLGVGRRRPATGYTGQQQQQRQQKQQQQQQQQQHLRSHSFGISGSGLSLGRSGTGNVLSTGIGGLGGASMGRTQSLPRGTYVT
jgi:transcription initiation factor TFIID subunit TAF12